MLRERSVGYLYQGWFSCIFGWPHLHHLSSKVNTKVVGEKKSGKRHRMWNSLRFTVRQDKQSTFEITAVAKANSVNFAGNRSA